MSRSEAVSIDYVECLLEYAEQQGYDVAPLLAAVGVSKSELNQMESFPAESFGKLYQRMMWLAQDESFGMLTGGKMPHGTFRMMCHCLISAQTLGQAINRCISFYEICKGPTIKPRLDIEGKSAVFRFEALDSLPESTLKKVVSNESPTVIRTSLSIWHHFMSWMIGRRLPLEQVCFSFAEQPNRRDYELLFRGELEFNAAENCFRFPAELLDSPVVQTEKTLRSFLQTAPYQLIVMVNGDDSISAQIRTLFGRDFSRPLPAIEQTAEALNMSVRTLRRYLVREGTSYQQLKDESRRDAAVDFLNCPELSIQEVAELVGFEEASPFIRAFRKWTDQTPGEYREQLLAQY